MARGRKGKSKNKSSKGGKKGGNGSRQKDRKPEKVDFEDVAEPVVIDREGSNNFIQISRTEAVGRKSGNVISEFLYIKPGFYNDDDEECFNRKCEECERAPGVTFSPAMLGEVVDGLMDMATEDEAEEYGWEEEEEDDDEDDGEEDD